MSVSIAHRGDEATLCWIGVGTGIRFDRNDAMPEAEVRALLAEPSFSIANMSDRITRDGPSFEYRMTIRTTNPDNTVHLAASLRKPELVREFRISPMGD